MIEMTEPMTTSLGNFLRSESAYRKFHELMRTGDIAGSRSRLDSAEIDERYDEAIRIWQSGESLYKAASLANINYHTLRLRMRKNGVDHKQRKSA